MKEEMLQKYTTEMQRFLREYYEQLYDNKLENLE